MLFDTDKCKVLHFGFNNPHINYTMDGVKLQLVKEDTGVSLLVSLFVSQLVSLELAYCGVVCEC